MKTVLFLFGALLCQILAAQPEIKVRIFSDRATPRAVVTTDTGRYHLLALTADFALLDTVYDIFPADSLRTFYLSVEQGQVLIKRGSKRLGRFPALYFRSPHPRKDFRIDAAGQSRAYHGDLRFSVSDKRLLIVNCVSLEQYVAGVVESEAGHVGEKEFFKAQAVMARTFALRNLDKFRDEGYDLTDNVSAQVYHNKAHYTFGAMIDSAVQATRDTLLVLPDCQPVLGVFHANSGGYTANSEDVWQAPVPYLKARRDSFSEAGKSFRWEKTVARQEFMGFIAQQLGVEDNLFLRKAVLNFDQEDRHSHFRFRGKELKLTELRRRFGLRSTFFSVEEQGDSLLLKGKGYGHGVGLSQDGAIEMSRRGYSYRQILHFYYSGVELEAIERLPQFAELTP